MSARIVVFELRTYTNEYVLYEQINKKQKLKT